ncbi:MAG: aromatic ring-hydroxylating dioxygenase subunit alpha [Paludibacter sp.]|nr:aromatic ring-hydroxylating dioxygenase subunit alpha [Paludibacter sp.]
MIYNQWYVILESREVKTKKPIKVTRLNETLTLWRDESGKVCCIANRCCHRGASLSCGKLVTGNIECPFHGFQFDGDGKVKIIPANGKNAPIPESQHVQAYHTYENYGLIWMWWGDSDKKTDEPFFFKELIDMSYSTFIDSWNVHYSRAIENQLDVVHLPFIHKTTIGKGNKTLVNGPVVVREGELITLYVNNISDDGKTVPLKPDEIPDYEKLFHLQFHYPNIWQNIISDKFRIFAAFVPVDDEHSLIYLRNYQKILSVPIIKNIANYIMKLSNIVILRQDKRIVVTQLPKKTDLKMDEHLIMGDKPIIEYRKHRQELMEK